MIPIIAIMLFASIIMVQTRLSSYKTHTWKQESMTYLPQSDRIKPLLCGFHTTYAHYLWIRTILYFGTHYITDKEFPWLINMIDIITKLNPHFYPAYEFAGLIIPDLCNNPAAARIILERGMNSIGHKKWNIPFYLGLIHYQHYDDNERAAHLFALAARVPGAPMEKLGGLAATLYYRSGHELRARNLLGLLYESSESPDVRRHIENKMQALFKLCGINSG